MFVSKDISKGDATTSVLEYCNAKMNASTTETRMNTATAILVPVLIVKGNEQTTLG